jgi:hypothetical protein
MIITTRLAELSVASADGTVPATINYKGILTAVDGTPMTITISAVFAIYDQPVLGSVKWTETRGLTSDAEGRITILLGQVTPFHDGLFDTSPLYLAAQVGSDGGQTQRIVITSAPDARRLTLATAGTINRIAEDSSDGPGSVMGVRDPGGNIGDVGSVTGVRDPGGNVGDVSTAT